MHICMDVCVRACVLRGPLLVFIYSFPDVIVSDILKPRASGLQNPQEIKSELTTMSNSDAPLRRTWWFIHAGWHGSSEISDDWKAKCLSKRQIHTLSFNSILIKLFKIKKLNKFWAWKNKHHTILLWFTEHTW